MLPEQKRFIREFYETSFDKLFKCARRSLGNEMRAREAVQDTFVEAIDKVEILMAHPKPEAWLIKTLQFKCCNIKKENMRDKKRVIAMEPEELNALVSCSSAETIAMKNETFRELEEVVCTKLSDEERYVLRRFVLEDASHLEISKEINTSVWNCQKRLERARKRLKQYIPEDRRK